MTDAHGDHECEYRKQLVWGEWRSEGGWRERVGRQIPICGICGREQPARRPRPAVRRERESGGNGPAPLADGQSRRVASLLALKGERSVLVRAKGLLNELARRGVEGSRAEAVLDQFLEAGWLKFVWRVRNTRDELYEVSIRDQAALEEHARPGSRAAKERLVAEAEERLRRCEHPVVETVRAVLASPDCRRLTPEHVRALTAIALHAESGEVLSERVFSTRFLGDSKALRRVRARIETLVGSLAECGIREGVVLVLLGGAGALSIGESTRIDLSQLRPCIGLSLESLRDLRALDCPEAGLLVVENLTAFEACCRGEVSEVGCATVVWSEGYPGRGVRILVEEAARASAPIRVWADLDLHGVRIARLVQRWSPSATPWHMAPEDLRRAAVSKSLSQGEAAAIRRDLESRPDEVLSVTLRAFLDERATVEQEALLGQI